MFHRIKIPKQDILQNNTFIFKYFANVVLGVIILHDINKSYIFMSINITKF